MHHSRDIDYREIQILTEARQTELQMQRQRAGKQSSSCRGRGTESRAPDAEAEARKAELQMQRQSHGKQSSR